MTDEVVARVLVQGEWITVRLTPEVVRITYANAMREGAWLEFERWDGRPVWVRPEHIAAVESA